MSLVVSSTTDTQEAVNAAAGVPAPAPESAPAETAAPPPAGTEEPADAEPDEQDDEGEDKPDDGPEETGTPPPARKKGGYLRKIERLERENGYAARRIEELEQVLAGPRPAGAPEPPAGPPARPSPDQFPEDYEGYIQALSAYNVQEYFRQEREHERKQKFVSDRQQEIERWQQAVGAFRSRIADYDDVLAQTAHIELSPALQQALVSAEDGPRLAYELARDHKELERIAALPPVAAVRELGKFEARLAASGGPPKKVSVSRAPEPITPVGQGATTSTKPLDEMSYQEFKRARERQIAGRRKAR